MSTMFERRPMRFAESGSTVLAAITTKSINNLPDSAFAFIESGGKKDADGKTIPRSLRHFPIHDAAHVRNALARASQSPHGDKAMVKIRAAASKFGIKVAASETYPGFPFAEDPNDPIHYGFIVDLENVQLGEGDDETKSWIQAFPIGKWQHPEYGEIEMTLDKAVRMAANVNMNARGQELDIDYDHKARRDDAAGWVKQAQARPDGLWILVDWTREAYQKIKEKAYKYFSPEFSNVWKHVASGQIFKDVLWGGALTNRPHLKGIQAINLSEYLTPEEVAELNAPKDQKSDTRELLEALSTIYTISFDENTDDATLVKSLSERLTKRVPAPTAEPVPTFAQYMQEDWSSFEIPQSSLPGLDKENT